MEVEEVEEDEEGSDATWPRPCLRPLLIKSLRRMQQEANTELRSVTGFELPAWSDAPAEASRSRRHAEWAIDIPEGPLFYPSCGGDIVDAGRMFAPYLSEFHFADPFNPPNGAPGAGVQRRRFPPGPMAARPNTHSLPHIGSVVTGVSGSSRSILDGIPAVYHRKDGLLTLLEDLGPIAVFFYRGDSAGEGGSDQRWLMPVLFDLVMARLMSGGLIYTDGSNGAGTYGGDADPTQHVSSLPVSAEVGQRLLYRNRTLTCVFRGPPACWGHPELVWQVNLRPVQSFLFASDHE